MRLQYIAVLALAAFLAGWQVNGWRLERNHSEYREAQQQALADAVTAAREQEAAAQQRIAQMDQRYNEELSHAQEVNDRLRTDIERSRVRLSVPTTSCGGVSADPSTAGGADEASRAELDPQAAGRIVAVAQDGDAAIRQLTALQEYVRTACRGTQTDSIRGK